MPSRLRNALSAVLIAVACLLVPFGALAAWVAYGLADTGRYVTTMAPLAADPDVREVIADTVGAGIVREVDVGGPMRPFVRDAVRSFTRTEAFRTAWDAGNRAVHDAVLRALRDGDDREVTVDLAPVAAEVKHRLTEDRVPLAHRIPVRHTEVAVLAAEDLARLRKGFHVLDVAGFWLPVTAAVLAVIGIAVAACRRRAVTATALGTALGGALLALAVAVGRRLTLADLPDPAHRPAAGAIYDALTATLRTVSWSLVAVGLTVALVCLFTGRYGRLLRWRPRRGSAAPSADPAQEPTRARA
ncbi:hypothetical protein [Streptomyces resistomycificus]|uniref:Membrane protein n=1 Tax=Streptomyces resistomycificus TaxID=67356 RepID=A0A0L8LAB3_9ACTN|nr:hypothetical protein [Streptomyces resistomycificus]KOG35001.1 membrane protein [Streptomyces resistomycificus]KUN97686.1 hypothetical protein AQJ84_16350 [Streptomyces resistomycificus]